MKRYLLTTLQDALLIWIVLEIGIIISSVLYAILSIVGVSENISLLIAFLCLIGLIILGLLFPNSFFVLKLRLRRGRLRKQRQSKPIEQLAEDLVGQQKNLDELTQIQLKEQGYLERIEYLEKVLDNVVAQQESLKEIVGGMVAQQKSTEQHTRSELVQASTESMPDKNETWEKRQQEKT